MVAGPSRFLDSAASHGRFRNLLPGSLASVIFGCSNTTIKESLERKLFGLPRAHIAYVKNVKPGMPLFLFNFNDKKLHGIFEAASWGNTEIHPHAWTNNSRKTPYPAQVLVRVRQIYPSLPERVFKKAIAANYSKGTHFFFELDETQTRELMRLFMKGASSVGMKPLMIPAGQNALPLMIHATHRSTSEAVSTEFRPAMTLKSSQEKKEEAGQNALPFIPATHRSWTSEAVSTKVRPGHWEDTSAGYVKNAGQNALPLMIPATHSEISRSLIGATCGWGGEEDSVEQGVFAQGDLLSFYGGDEKKAPTSAEWEHKGKWKQKQRRLEKLDTGCEVCTTGRHNRKAQDGVEIPEEYEQALRGEEYEEQTGSIQKDGSVATAGSIVLGQPDPLIPGLTDDIAMIILNKLPADECVRIASFVSRGWWRALQQKRKSIREKPISSREAVRRQMQTEQARSSWYAGLFKPLKPWNSFIPSKYKIM